MIPSLWIHEIKKPADEYLRAFFVIELRSAQTNEFCTSGYASTSFRLLVTNVTDNAFT